jgi:hypothetical protein
LQWRVHTTTYSITASSIENKSTMKRLSIL